MRTRLHRARLPLRRGLGGRFFEGDRFEGERAAFAAALGTLDSATHWTSELLMKKALLQIPMIVGGFVGAGIGFGGSLLIRGEPASGERNGETPAKGMLVSHAAEAAVAAGERTREPELTMPARVPVRPPGPRAVQSILEALPAQESADLRQSYVWTVSMLATQYSARPIDQSFHDVRRLVEDALLRGDGAWTVHLRWLWGGLERHREKKGA